MTAMQSRAQVHRTDRSSSAHNERPPHSGDGTRQAHAFCQAEVGRYGWTMLDAVPYGERAKRDRVVVIPVGCRGPANYTGRRCIVSPTELE